MINSFDRVKLKKLLNLLDATYEIVDIGCDDFSKDLQDQLLRTKQQVLKYLDISTEPYDKILVKGHNYQQIVNQQMEALNLNVNFKDSETLVVNGKVASKLSKNLIRFFQLGYWFDHESNSIRGFNFSKKIDRVYKSQVYPQFALNYKGRCRTLPIHKIIAIQKFGISHLFEGLVVRHLDDDPMNMSFDNIEIGTMSQNIMDMSPNRRSLRATNGGLATKGEIPKEKVFELLYRVDVERSKRKLIGKTNLEKGFLKKVCEDLSLNLHSARHILHGEAYKIYVKEYEEIRVV